MYMKFDDTKERTLGLLFGTVSIPISGWWGGAHELQERKIKENIAENNFRDNEELLALQIEKSWQDLTTAYKQYLLSEESKVQAEENYKVNADSYKNGITKLSDLLEAQALLQQTLDQLTDAKTDYMNKKNTYLPESYSQVKIIVFISQFTLSLCIALPGERIFYSLQSVPAH